MVKRSSNRVEYPDRTVIDRWSGGAPFWEKHREIIRQMFAPVTQGLLEDGMIDTGQVVLDIATGPGELREKVAMLSGGQLAEVKREAFEAFGEYFTGSGMSFPSQVLIVSGTKSDRHS